MSENTRTDSESSSPSSPDATPTLDQLGAIDGRLADLIKQREQIVSQLAAADQLPTAMQEKAALGLVLNQTSGEPTPPAQACNDSLWQTLLHIASHCRDQINDTSVSFLGPKYSYSHLAAVKFFGEAAPLAPVTSIAAVFDAVHRGDAKYGLVPIENSTDGRIVDTLGMFVRRHMQICGEVLLPIHHNLLASGTRDQITEIHSKPQALSQCRQWLAANFPAAKLIEVGSTTAAAESAAQDPSIAAVASLPAGRAYGLQAINQNIEDNRDNVTRFAVLGREQPQPTGSDKTSLLLQVAHRPGALADVMKIFQQAELNLTWIESFPMPGSRNEYLFFVEFSGHRDQPSVQTAVAQLGTITHRLEILGSYPVAS